MSFKDIKGQDKPIGILRGYLNSSSLSGAYLFTGEEGIGKRLIALNFAKAINCLNPVRNTAQINDNTIVSNGVNNDSCDICSSCLKIEKNQHPDIHFIGSGDSEVIKIEAIRDLKKDISLKPYEAKKKVFIIDDAHRLTAEAQNAILKILEEPPKDSLIILVSAKPTLLFKTIISRCKLIKFYPLRRLELKEFLKKDYHLDNHQVHFLAYFSEGRLGKALKLMETDVLNQRDRIIDDFVGVGRHKTLESLSIQNRNQMRDYLNILATWFRDMYLIKVGIAHSELINFDHRDELRKLANRYSFFDLDEILNSISDSLLYLEQNANIKLLLGNLRAQLWRRRYS